MNDFEKRKNNAVARMAKAKDLDMLARAARPECRGIRSSIGDDPLAELRLEALLVLGYAPDHKGEISAYISHDRPHSAVLEQTLGRCLIRYLNRRARAN